VYLFFLCVCVFFFCSLLYTVLIPKFGGIKSKVIYFHFVRIACSTIHLWEENYIVYLHLYRGYFLLL
jgi:hypothetical protein